MIYYKSDRSNVAIPHEECSELRLSGPLASMIGRKAVHLDKPEALAFAKWLGFELARPELETIAGPEAPEPDPVTSRVKALTNGTPANSRPPKGRASNPA